jgi:hypothetical protein
MPRTFDLTTEYQGSVAEVHDAFCDRSYWAARLAGSGADDAVLDVFQVGRDGGVDVVTTQVLRADRLPALVRQFHRGDIHIRRAETWTGLTDDGAEATLAGSVENAPITLHGRAMLAPADQGARLSWQADVEVSIPLVGRKLENFIGSQLMALLSSEQEFTTSWIAAHR